MEEGLKTSKMTNKLENPENDSECEIKHCLMSDFDSQQSVSDQFEDPYLTLT